MKDGYYKIMKIIMIKGDPKMKKQLMGHCMCCVGSEANFGINVIENLPGVHTVFVS